jgi:hypothetical protein
MTPRAIRRAAAMSAAELRARALTAASLTAERIRFAAARPAWRRSAIARLLDPGAGGLVREAHDAAARGDYLAAHRALGRHFETRAPRWPVAAARRQTLTQEIRDRFPTAAIGARDRADLILDGRFDLLGYHDLSLGHPPDWHADAVHGRRAPRGFWSTVPFLDPASGDHKIIWELNRHQHFLLLGTAFWLTGRRAYRDAVIAHLEDWLLHNPPLDGVNWASMLELAFRTLAWTWAVEFFSTGADTDETPWLIDLLVAIDRQLVHVERNLSTYFSPNTHLSGEALALYAVSRALPELRASAARADAGRAILLREARAQVGRDGGHVERSSHYHRYSTDFYLLAHHVAVETGDTAADFEPAMAAQAAFLRTIADDRGRLPHLGDEDGGQLFRFGAATPDDAAPTLAAAASVLGDPAIAVAPPTPEAYWILGRAPRPAGPVPAAWPSRILADTGYVVLRRASHGDHLIFDAGPHGFLNGGHAHADALAVVLTVGGMPLLVDSGTPTYTMDLALRDRCRLPEAHNTVTIDGRPFARPRGPFHWEEHADARLLAAGADTGFAVAMHTGYGVPIVRAVIAVADAGWLIVDYVPLRRSTRIDAHWHLHPSWSAATAASGFVLTHASGTRLALATTASGREIETGYPWSPEYGRIQAATSLKTSERASQPIAIAAYVPARLGARELPSVRLLASRALDTAWVGFTFAISTGAIDILADIAFPVAPEARPARDWPQPCIQELRAVCVE